MTSEAEARWIEDETEDGRILWSRTAGRYRFYVVDVEGVGILPCLIYGRSTRFLSERTFYAFPEAAAFAERWAEAMLRLPAQERHRACLSPARLTPVTCQ